MQNRPILDCLKKNQRVRNWTVRRFLRALKTTHLST